MSDLTTLEQLERRVGQKPDTASFTLTASNREAVEDWLIAQGFDETRIRSAREDTIRKAYSVPTFRRALKNRGDYYPAASRTTQENRTDDRLAENMGGNAGGHERTAGRHTQIDRRSTPVDNAFGGGAPRTTEAPGADQETGHERSRSAPNLADHPPAPAITPIDPADHALILASAIQALAGSGISEQRVVALIQQHVPAIVRQVLSEALAAVAVNLDLE